LLAESDSQCAPLRPAFREAAHAPGGGSAARQIPMAGSAPNLRVQLAGAIFSKEASRWWTGEPVARN